MPSGHKILLFAAGSAVNIFSEFIPEVSSQKNFSLHSTADTAEDFNSR